MLEKAVEWFKNQEETGIPWLDDYEIRLFRKYVAFSISKQLSHLWRNSYE